jgi:hypothetical protein
MQIYFVILASLLAVAGNTPYIRDVLKNKVFPHPVSWLLWSIVSLVTFLGVWQKGGGIGSIPMLISELFTLTIFFISLKNGFKNVNRKDLYLLATALLGLIPWIITKDPTLSVLVVVAVDLVAFVPTITKTYKNPSSENHLLYGSNVIRHVLIILSLQAYNLATTSHSVTMLVLNIVMVYLIVFHIYAKNK